MLRVLGAVAALSLLGLAAVLVEAHCEIRGIEPPIPAWAELDERLSGEGGPVRIRYVNSATQQMPDVRAGMHPGFLLEWPDGRAFLVDVGMERAGALAFGRPFEWLLDAPPVEPHGSVGEQLGEAARRIAGIGFTHLHMDHTGGLFELCDAIGHEVPVFQTSWQAERANYGTAPGVATLRDAPCVRPERLADAPLSPVPGFPGLYAIAAAGHTPGSTMFVARIDGTTWLLSGDVSNAKQNLLADRPKLLVYSLLIVPEHRARLGELRRWLAGLDARPEVEVVVSHDLGALRASGMEAW